MGTGGRGDWGTGGQGDKGTKTAGQVWQLAMEQLRLELLVGVPRLYLLDIWRERYEAAGGVFVFLALRELLTH